MEREIKNAKIDGVRLGYEDHGIFTCSLTMNYGGAGQGFGGYSLDTPNGKRGKDSRRIGTAYGMEFLIHVLKTVGVDTWEELKGKHIRVDCEWGKVHGIGHIIEDKWFYPENDLVDFVERPPRRSGGR